MEKLENMFRVKKFLTDPTSRRFSIFLSQSKDCSWILELHGKLRKSDHEMVHGDNLIRLQHTESKALIGADIPMTNPLSEIYARKYNGQIDIEKNTLDCIWEIEHVKMDKRGQNFDCKLLKNDLNENYRLSTPFRLRHFVTGRYFTKERINRLNMALLSPHEDARNPANYAVLQFEPLMKSIENIKFGHSYYLRSENSYVRHK